MKRITNFGAELYIWALPAVSVIVLYLIKNTFGREVFIVAVGIHLLFITAALWRFSRSRSSMSGQHLNSSVLAAALLLIAGATLTFISATTFSGTQLSSVSIHKFEHYWTSGGFFLATIVSLAGLTLLTWILLKRKNTVAPVIGLIAIILGTMAWLAHLSFRLTAMVWTADEVGAGIVPGFYEMSNRWAGFLYVIYMVFTYLAFIAYGISFLQTGLLPKWLGKANIVFGLLASLLFIIGVMAFGMPITIQLMPWLIGIFLIRSDCSRI